MDKPNGYSNGYAKGPKMNGINGHAVGAKRSSPSVRGSSIFARLFSIAARLVTWYSIISILFRCPATIELCDETAPKICKPYFQAKALVSPHLEPYYDAYAAPYIELARPYYDTAEKKVISPARTYAVKYGGPVVNQAQAYGQVQWNQKVQPQLASYQKLAQEQYDEKVSPHVASASAAVGPYYEIARTSALQTYHEVIFPSYELAQPYLAQGYGVASQFATDTAIPSFFWAWNKTYVFLDTTVWPQLRVLYVQNVEPQLARIGQRLGRYREKSKLSVESVTESVHSATSSFSKPTSSVSSAPASTASQVIEDLPIPDPAEIAKHDASEQVIPPVTAETPVDDSDKTPQEIVMEDLEQWQTKFAKAADEGAAEIEERIDEISKEMIKNDVNKKGKSLVSKLQDTASAQISALQTSIIDIVSRNGPDAGDEIIAAVRKSGLAVKENAQAVRDWKNTFEGNMEIAITKAAENHFKILDSIRDLALQRIGMKWAWMDGITYKDWAKFHELKDKFDEWTDDLKKLIVTHPALDDTREASGHIEDSAMAVAQETAQELARLKQVGFWKLAAADASDNFDSDAMREAADAAEQAKIEAAQRAAEERAASERAAAERVAAEKAAAAAEANQATAADNDDQQTADLPVEADPGTSEPEADPLESAASIIEDESPATNLQEEKEEPVVSSAGDGILAEASESAASVVSQVSSAVVGDKSPEASPDLASTIVPGDDMTFVVNDTGSSPADDDSQQPLTPEDKAEEKLDAQLDEEIVAESAEDKPVEAETATVKPAFLGAMAQEVPSRGGPILDEDPEDEAESYSAKAQEAYAQAVAQASQKYSIAMSAVSAKLYGTPEPEPVQEQMFAGIAARFASATNVANARLSDALDAASKGIYGQSTPTPTPSYDWSQIEAIAAQRLFEGRVWAEEQYEAAKIALGLATATPTATNEKLLDQAKANYYAGLGAAQARYSEFLASAAAAMSTFTAIPTPTDAAGTVFSVASKATESAGALASGASVDGLHVVSVVGDGFNAAASVVGEAVNAAAQEVLDAAQAVERGVTETWENVVAHLSAQIYGAPTPTSWYGNAKQDAEQYAAKASSQAAKQYEIVYAIIQELVVGKEPTFSESVLSRVQAAYATGASSASAYFSQATQAAGDSANAAREKANAAAAAAADAIRQNLGRDEL
ncbi:hypothetical protein F5X68DRAFT_45087 [Plectosphaerella plurivora]|uniref:Transcription factor hoxa13 n=1 Tax=Plectosphaerella plurivora TaxID=936078 RepID=A0A9P8VIQ5_9PEZI|nr:hypothetical protein F5X68DRAFT_45087 [Plectosphaerella plurivora]